jgi:hypothetical protein
MEPRRRVVAGLTGAAIVLIGIGVAAVVFDAGFGGGGGATIGNAGTSLLRPSSPPATASPTVPPSVPIGSGIPGTPQPIVSASPLVSPGSSQRQTGFVSQGNGFAYDAADGSVIPVTPIPGLEVDIQAGRAKYFALASNGYGLASGSYAGEFMPLVTMGQPDGSSAETGGIVLAGQVVAQMIKDKLAPIKAPGDQWIVALPVDIRTSFDTTVDVSFDQFGLAGWSNTPRVLVQFSGTLPIVETIPNNGGFHVLVEQLGVTAWQVVDPTRLSLPSGAIDPAHAMNQLLVYGSGTPNTQRDVTFDRHVGIGQLLLSATSDVSVSLVVNGSRADLGPSKVLTVGDVPVFVASS